MDTKLPTPALPKARPARFTTLDAFAAAYLRLHGHATAEPEKSTQSPAVTAAAE